MNVDEVENKGKMLRGELYYAFTPKLTAERQRCQHACKRYNSQRGQECLYQLQLHHPRHVQSDHRLSNFVRTQRLPLQRHPPTRPGHPERHSWSRVWWRNPHWRGLLDRRQRHRSSWSHHWPWQHRWRWQRRYQGRSPFHRRRG
ncbi:uncharacterized protein BKA78DRAFT_93042 [Phyllosticta capitalensis]|uniref:uncharacterized protein n=1 Tax=Phyllosticta capitalensis TaxID=121624 RepID=UPI00312FE70D